ncbi:EAL domain-containing protein [Methylosinus sp. PW1]|uniref:EAL domain-containing protein n=1 Tax=Methylosinus sp. PW1 TaxID=107636 RepID=UPI00055A40C0|nr:EAL domain-containing protein [Methylosinus sp. PW1]
MPLSRYLIALLFLVLCGSRALAIDSVRVPQDASAIDLTHAVEKYSSEGDRLQVSTAPGSDGIIRRIEVGAKEVGTRPSWIVFALTNDTDEQLERLIVAPHFRLQGSGVIWPDLGATRISAITASQGFPPEHEESGDADVFRLTLDPGTTITYVAELRTPNLPQLYLWEPDSYKDKVTSLTLYKGIVIGIAGLLALFLTIVFVVKGAVIFPAAAALAWSVLAYVCIDFGFWAKIFGVDPNADRIWRAGAETVLSATLVVFLFAYLNLNRWHVRAWHVAALWLLILADLVGLAIFDAPVAAGVARISLATVSAVGFVLVLYLATHGFDRAIMLIPTWFLLLLWVCAAGFTVAGWLTNDLVSPALVGGLVLIVMLIGFTVMQNAFASGGLAHGAISDTERKALALTGANEIVFDWDVPADYIYVSPEVEEQLGLDRGGLEGAASSWLALLHPFEHDRYRACLDSLLEQRRGRINQEFRLRAADGHYFCYRLRARPVIGQDGEVIRVVGTLIDVTDERNARERLLHDAVHDNLTGLPNRELFFDRLEAALVFAGLEAGLRPTVLAVDIDRFRQINEQVGVATGDSILLTIAHRLTRLLQQQDTLARLDGDRFAIILVSETNADHVIALADSVRRTLATPVRFTDREISLSVSIGVALFDKELHPDRHEMLEDAEIALRHAKKLGGNRIEVFRPAMRAQRSDRLTLEADLRRALERGEIKVFFQPVVRLEDRTIAGFEALLRWDHPRLGQLDPSEFGQVAEQTGLVVDFGLLALERTARELAAWQRALAVDPPIFACVNIGSRQLLRHDLLRDVKSVLMRNDIVKGSLKLELSEGLVMENPEYAAQMLGRIKELGAGLAMSDFGSGYSSLAYLQSFPFDTIKIGRSFTRQTGKGSRAVILRSLISLAHDLGMDVVAEGAETESDAIELYQLGCAYAQGYAFGRPISPMEARRLVGAAPEAA